MIGDGKNPLFSHAWEEQYGHNCAVLFLNVMSSGLNKQNCVFSIRWGQKRFVIQRNCTFVSFEAAIVPITYVPMVVRKMNLTIVFISFELSESCVVTSIDFHPKQIHCLAYWLSMEITCDITAWLGLLGSQW